MESYKKINNTYIKDDKDKFNRLEIEVGDIKQDDFQPQVKLKRWDSECNASFRFIDDETDKPEIKTEGDKIKFLKKKTECHFYNVKDGFEFEVLLKEKPKTNKVQMSIQTKDLDFFYQPELTEKEKKTCRRPENVIGSYAVYHKTKQGDYSKVGGKNYRAGKAFHIYRPKIVDKNGDWTWGKLNIDKDILTITVPQKWLDNAVYPIMVDPTFGYTSNGASDTYIPSGQANGTKFTASEAGTGSSISVYIKDSTDGGSTSEQFKCAIYNSSDNLISNGTTNECTDDLSSSLAWKTMSFGISPSFSSGTNRLVLFTNGQNPPSGNPILNVGYDTGVANQTGYDGGNTYPTFPNSFSADSNDNKKFSIYCTYTAGGGGFKGNSAHSFSLT